MLTDGLAPAALIRRTFAVIAVLVAVLSLCLGCGTLDSAKVARGTGARRTYEASTDQVWNALPSVLTQLGLNVASSSRPEGYVLAKRGFSNGSWGENVAVFIAEISPSRTEVEVVSKKVLATNVTAKNWENPVLNKIEDFLRTAGK
jgi:hypothetical protein